MNDTLQFSQSLREWMDTFVHRSMRESARFVKASGFSMPQFFLLMHLHRHEQCGISDLSERMDVTAAATSQLVDKLVQAGLLVREEDPHDRRAKKISLSPAGEEMIEKGIVERSRWLGELAETLNDDERMIVADAFKILTEKSKVVEM